MDADDTIDWNAVVTTQEGFTFPDDPEGLLEMLLVDVEDVDRDDLRSWALSASRRRHRRRRLEDEVKVEVLPRQSLVRVSGRWDDWGVLELTVEDFVSRCDLLDARPVDSPDSE